MLQVVLYAAQHFRIVLHPRSKLVIVVAFLFICSIVL
jgi:hypothetical protein